MIEILVNGYVENIPLTGKVICIKKKLSILKPVKLSIQYKSLLINIFLMVQLNQESIRNNRYET